ncbi:Methyl farnesoate epoxidase [Amphibalanus amphitrite]|uniref:Methyl farnesoate epoxidase n=1 Tax=Amphibalanus amphitrite TaxID=1232801 RepID=A0A6A4W7V7_AMPAM|nr:Methyl farnesoate epoxidase [Amphibalanus amphitrite]
MEAVTALLVLLLLLLAGLWALGPSRPANFPPGPRPWSWLGTLPELLLMARLGQTAAFDRLARRYGPQAFGEPAFTGRPDIFAFIYRAFMKKQGLVFAEGDLWTEHRRFALSHLRQLGFGKRSMERHMADEYRGLSHQLRAAAGRPLPLRGLFDASIINVIWQVIAGRRYALGDGRLAELQATIAELVSVAGVTVPMNVCPPVRHLLPRWSGFQLADNHRRKVADMFAELVREHAGHMARRGACSGSWTAPWAGAGCRSWPDLPRLPLLRAVIEEVLRRHTVLPHALPHCTSFGAAPLGRYTVPRGAFVYSDLRAVHMDETHWEEPAAFRPDRFLDGQGQFRADERHVAFGVGRRRCPAETVARQELLLFTWRSAAPVHRAARRGGPAGGRGRAEEGGFRPHAATGERGARVARGR